MRSTLYFVPLLALAFPAAATPQTITESEALARIGDGHPALGLLAAGEDRAAAERSLAALYESPELALMRERPSGLATQTDVTLSWRPPLDGRRRLAVAAAEAGIAVAGWETAAGRLLARSEVRAAFAAWWASGARLAALEDHAGRLVALADRARTRAAGGEESGLAARRLAAEAAQAEADAGAALATAGRRRAEVAVWITDLGADALAAMPPLPAVPPSLSVSGRADLAALVAEVQRRELAAELAGRIAWFPELTAGWQRVEQDGGEHSGLVAGLRWDVPLTAQSRAGRARAEADLGAARAALELATSRAAAELAAEYAAFAALREAAERSAAGGAEADRLIAAATLAFSLGEADVTDTLDTLRAALGSRLRAVDTRAAALSSHRALELASGQELVLGGDR